MIIVQYRNGKKIPVGSIKSKKELDIPLPVKEVIEKSGWKPLEYLNGWKEGDKQITKGYVITAEEDLELYIKVLLEQQKGSDGKYYGVANG